MSERKYESYEDLFLDDRIVDKLDQDNNMMNGNEIRHYLPNPDHDECNYSKENIDADKNLEEKYEQNHIISTENDDFSLEADGDDGSFEDAAEENPNTNNEEENSGNNEDMDFDTSGSDMDFDEDMNSDDSSDDTGGESNSDGDGGIDIIDNNKGSSLNPYTQINQKRWSINSLNELSKVIKNALDLYNPLYSDWSEVDQLKDLSKIIEDEKRSFVMQQNPENLINIGLYYEACDLIVQKIVDKINVNKNKERS